MRGINIAANREQKPLSSAADARKRSAKCASAHEQADDNADVVLLGGFFYCSMISVPNGGVKTKTSGATGSLRVILEKARSVMLPK